MGKPISLETEFLYDPLRKKGVAMSNISKTASQQSPNPFRENEAVGTVCLSSVLHSGTHSLTNHLNGLMEMGVMI